MHVFLTGGNGLVGANIARRILSEHAGARLTVLDLDAADGLAREHLRPFGDRVAHACGDIRDPGSLLIAERPETITHVVHAAAVAHVPEWEATTPARFFDVNLGGTLNVIEWARGLPSLRRLLYVSTGGVYGEPGALSPSDAQPEDGPFDPPELYAISKFAAERAVRRLGVLYDIDTRAIRLSAVFGPMERPSAGRRLMSLPYMIARSLARARPLRLTRRTLDAGGDFLSAEDVAAGAVSLLTAPTPSHFDYNVAFGRFTLVPELLAAVTEAAPSFRFVAVDDREEADVDMDPSNRGARWNAYSTERIRRDTSWAPRPLAEQFRAYLGWLEEAKRSASGVGWAER